MNFLDAGNRFTDLLRELTHFAHPRLAEQIHFLLQPRNDVTLDRIEQDRGDPHERVLRENIEDRGHQQAALKRRHGKGIADETAKRLDLGGDHRDQLALRDLAKMRQRKTQDARIEQITQAPQHALTHAAFIDVDVHLEAAIDEHEEEKNNAERAEQCELAHIDNLNAEHRQRARKFIPLNSGIIYPQGRVYDQLGNIKRSIVKRHRADGHQEDIYLLPLGVLEDEFVDILVHADRRSLLFPPD